VALGELTKQDEVGVLRLLVADPRDAKGAHRLIAPHQHRAVEMPPIAGGGLRPRQQLLQIGGLNGLASQRQHHDQEEVSHDCIPEEVEGYRDIVAAFRASRPGARQPTDRAWNALEWPASPRATLSDRTRRADAATLAVFRFLSSFPS